MAAKVGGGRRSKGGGEDLSKLNATAAAGRHPEQGEDRGPGQQPDKTHNGASAKERRRQEAREKRQRFLLAFVTRARRFKPKVEEAKVAYDGVRSEYNDIFAEAKLVAGLTRKDIEGHMASMDNPNEAADEAQRAEDRELLGLPVGRQSDDLDLQGARDANAWRAEGYRMAMAGEWNGKPPQECPPEMHQAVMSGADDAIAAIGASMKALESAAKEPKDGKATAQAKADARAEGAQADADQAQAEADEAKKAAAPADDFEASEEELAGQTVKAQAEAASEPVE